MNGRTGRTYSAYQLDTFQRCPKLWDLLQRWREPGDDWSVHMAIGAAIAAGLAALRKGYPERSADGVAEGTLRDRFVENDEWSFDGVYKHVLRGIDLGMSTDLGLETIISADEKMYGRCRPDVVGRTPEGSLRIVDDKTKLKLDIRYVDETLEEFKHSNQLYEYAWEVGRYYNEPVTSVCVNLIILSPKPISVFYPITLDPEVIDYWADSARRDFGEMVGIEELGWPARTRWTSCTDHKYRRKCPMWKACHDVAGDESKMEALGFERR